MKTLALGGLGVGLGAVIAVPAGAYITYPLRHVTVSGGTDFLVAGKLELFESTDPVKVDLYADRIDAWNRIEQVKIGSAWIVNEGGRLKAFSTVCPHLGCAVDYDGQNGKFQCPCHRSAFSRDGRVETGPSPRGMDELDVRQEDGLVAVRYQRFKQGSASKEPA